jgi:arylsulfatase A-like enzyme
MPAAFPGVRSILCAVLATCLLVEPSSQAPPRRHLLVVVDGLRPDYVTSEVMPRLTALGNRGVVFRRHHAVYPSVTRVNASSIATGAYPETHGLMGNSVYFPRVDPLRFLDTASRQALSRIAEVEGHLLTATTVGEVLQAAGRRMLVVSSGSEGSALLNHPTVSGGAILHPDFVLPERLLDDMKVLGEPPAGDGPTPARDRYAVDAFLKVGLPRVDPSVTVLWLGALDATAHARGIGDPATVDVLRHVDREIGRVEDGLAAAGLLDAYDIWVTSDHGFSTHTGAVDVAAVLQPLAATGRDGAPRIVFSGGAVYVRDGDDRTVAAIVGALQRTPGVGAIFTRGAQRGALAGRVAGTLSFDVARWDHERSADILFSPDWTDAPNAHGVRGTVASGGRAGHGSSSPWDIHNTLIAAGPDLARGITVEMPSANVDFVPTFLMLLGIDVPSSAQGRVLREALVSAAAGRQAPALRISEHTERTRDGRYSVTGHMSTVRVGDREYRYLDATTVTRQ